MIAPTFGNAALATEARTDLRSILEFGALPRHDAENPQQFLESLDRFLRAIGRRFRLAVEVRNPELLIPAYFNCLREHGAAHVYNAWAKMPDLPAQIAIPGSMTADFMVCRTLGGPECLYQKDPMELGPRVYCFILAAVLTRTWRANHSGIHLSALSACQKVEPNLDGAVHFSYQAVIS